MRLHCADADERRMTWVDEVAHIVGQLLGGHVIW
jgi:hypothetical protein